MTSIDPTSRLLGLLARGARELELGRQRPGSSSGRGAASTPAPSTLRRDPMEVALQEIAAIDPNDPRSPRLAFRAYLGAVLRRELEATGVGPDFASLLDRVEGAMERDPEIKQDMEQAGRHLLKRR